MTQKFNQHTVENMVREVEKEFCLYGIERTAYERNEGNPQRQSILEHQVKDRRLIIEDRLNRLKNYYHSCCRSFYGVYITIGVDTRLIQSVEQYDMWFDTVGERE